MSDAAQIAETLDDLAEQVAELAMEELRAEIDRTSDQPTGRRTASPRERKLASARRSIQKAAQSLREAS